MGAGIVHSNDLDDFVTECDRLGGIQSKDAIPFLSDFSLRFSTKIDETIDPFSEAYVNMQIELYKELSNRELKQTTGELTFVDIEQNVSTANPYGSKDINFIAKNAHAVLSSLLVSQVPSHAKILDMGCGWGLSTEMFAFCGAEVSAVDINPSFIELVDRRAKRNGYDVKVYNDQFDTFTSDTLFDLIFFYECLHHSIRPWDTIKRLSGYLAPNGKIAFAGEPITDMFWKNWGVRLDSFSVYCIRKFGWFESGWSEIFIEQCFNQAEFDLYLLPHVGLDSGIIGVARLSGDQESKMTSDPICSHYDLQQKHEKLQHAHQALLNSRWMKLRRALRFIKPF
ncbi:MAG: class I SAM-dependent methyltransferase [Desulfobacteraceae bacterium]